jgi:hypothetical protein
MWLLARRWKRFPTRLRVMLGYVWPTVAGAGRWLFTSRETTNFTYCLTDRNLRHLAWWVADLCSIEVEAAEAYMAELDGDDELRHLSSGRLAGTSDAAHTDDVLRFGRRVGWYAIVRARRPETIVETGTDKGLGALALAAAVKRNGTGRVITIDVRPDAGVLSRGSSEVEHVTGDSLQVLNDLDLSIDLFLHDSNHSADHEAAEYKIVERLLSPDALVLSDNAHAGDALERWATAVGRRFSYFHERPEGHWYPGAGIGAALR